MAQIIGKHLISPAEIAKSYEPQITINDALNAGYRIAVCDNSVSIPFLLSSELVRRASVFKSAPLINRPLMIFDYLSNKISYGDTRRKEGYACGIEVWENKQGVCGEMTYLYVSMARVAGINASYASVKVDYKANKCSHACALVKNTHNAGSQILVDIAYNSFGIKHLVWRTISDEQAWKSYLSWREQK